MRFGFCAGIAHTGLIEASGYDYIEPALAPLLTSRDDPAAAEPERVAAVRAIKPEAFNVFLPGDLKVTGPLADIAALERYVRNAFAAVSSLKGTVVVFGSGAARGVPDGFSQGEALGQIAEFLRMWGPHAAACGVVLAIEPLNCGECNIINSVAEAVQLAREVDHPAVQVLSDLYHVSLESQSYDETRSAGKLLAHVHVAGKSGRRAPISDDFEFLLGYFRALRAIDYDGRVSVEASITDLASEAPAALEVLRAAWDTAGR